MIKKYGFLIVTVILTLLFLFLTPEKKEEKLDIYTNMDTNLLVPQRNVVVATVDLKDRELSLFTKDSFKLLEELEQDFSRLEGVSKVESLLSAKVIKSEWDDIIVSGIIPGMDEINPDFLKGLSNEIPKYPELQPYINKSHDTLLFYVYFGNSIANNLISGQMDNLQKDYSHTLPFEYTGRAAILVKTEELLTKDIVIFLPLLILFVMVVFLAFRKLKAIVFAWLIILLSGASAYIFIHFLGMENSPLILLVPVFAIGLLSDYIIHYYYHLFYEEDVSRTVRSRLIFPLSLTALSTLTGFLSLIFLDGTGHLQLGSLISAAILVTFSAVFLWLPYQKFEAPGREILPRFRNLQTKTYTYIAGHKAAIFILLGILSITSLFQLPKLQIEPYPIEQLPEKNTVKKADSLINNEFFGTVPYFMEIDTGTANGIHSKDAILALDAIHTIIDDNESTGYGFSVLSVLKRMNYYFQGSEESLLTDSSFDDIYPMLVEQYLLYYSSSVDPLEYESLLDSSFRYLSIKGMVYYRNSSSLSDFKDMVGEIRSSLPEGWDLTVHGMISELDQEQKKLKNNWLISFLIGSILIFLTVIIFYRNIRLALLSLVPAVFSMILSFGLIATASLSIDTFSIIFVAIITGLVIDYSIHTLAAIEIMKQNNIMHKGYAYIVGYSGIPIFLSFLTSLFSFSVLFLSSFKGARNLGLLLISSLLISYFLSMFILPLLALSNPKSNKEVKS